MSPTRRDFLKATAATAAALASPGLRVDAAAQLSAPAADPFVLELANEALTAARSAGASYADVRVGRYRQQAIATRERQVQSVNDGDLDTFVGGGGSDYFRFEEVGGLAVTDVLFWDFVINVDKKPW